MSEMRFSEDHEYVRVEGDLAVIGITDHAQEQLGDIVFVDLPKVGKNFSKGDEAAVVESVKAAAEVYTPVSGEVVEINDAVTGNPALVNKDAEGAAWFLKVKLTDRDQLSTLMDVKAYRKYLKSMA